MKKRVLLIFAAEDRPARDWLVMHLANAQRLEFIDLSAEEPLDHEWKTRCRQHIRTCNYVIAILSKHTRAARAARWQMECAGEEGKPTLGVHKWADAKGKVPSELAGCTIIEWTWEGIGAFLEDRDGGDALESTAFPAMAMQSIR